MNRNHFLDTIEKSEISNHKDYLLQVLRPAIDILKHPEAELKLGCSRFGGAPDLPAGSEWPAYEMKPYRFLGQINFAEIPPTEADLPAKGLLSLLQRIYFLVTTLTLIWSHLRMDIFMVYTFLKLQI